jgi:ribosomal protein S18 acetylase RimI-like enzyme
MGIVIRPLEPGDAQAVRQILVACAVFTPEEINVALGLMRDVFVEQTPESYFLFGADIQGVVQGYVCLGKLPLTRGTWHLYWIAVQPRVQSRGIGQALQNFAEEFVHARAGERIGVETSSRTDYARARKFYRRAGYKRVGFIRDFYKSGDDCIILCKSLIVTSLS